MACRSRKRAWKILAGRCFSELPRILETDSMKELLVHFSRMGSNDGEFLLEPVYDQQ